MNNIEFPSYSVGYDLPTKATRTTQIINGWKIDITRNGLISIGDDGEEKFSSFWKLFEGDHDGNSSAKLFDITDQDDSRKCATEDQCMISSAAKATKVSKPTTKVPKLLKDFYVHQDCEGLTPFENLCCWPYLTIQLVI